MWTQRDQLQAYQFLRRRVVSALQFGDANHPASPTRRVLVSTSVGLGCALLVLAGVGVYGLLRPGANTDWRQPGRVVIERESGASFVLDESGALRPVLNFTSARLLAGPDATTVSVSAKSLAGAPRGLPLGIPGAPTSLPAKRALLNGSWSVCSQRPTGDSAGARATTTLTIGPAPVGREVGPGQSLYVRTGDASYLVADGRRFRVRSTAVVVALGYDGTEPVTVSDAWVGAIPAGPELALIRVAGSGDTGPRIGDLDTAVGQVLVADNVGGAQRYYRVRAGSLEPITQTEAALILGSRANRQAYGDRTPAPVQVSAADVAASGKVAATRSADNPATADYPALVPELVPVPPGATVLCATSAGTGPATLRVAPRVPVPAGARAVAVPRGDGETPTADRIYVPPGAGVLAIERRQGGAATGYLVSDEGVRYPVGSDDDVRALGYGGVRAVPVARTLLALLPTGPTLDSASAHEVVKR